MNGQSKFRPVSFGIAAENLKMGSKILEVMLVEWMPYADGEINADQTLNEVKGVTRDGTEYEASVVTANSVPAEWLPWGTNRVTPPNIRRGQRVMIYQFANSEKLWWTYMGLDSGLFKLETVVYMFSNTRDEEQTVLTPDNSYTIEVSTHTKQLTIRTNKSDGEPFAYTVQLNTKQGVFVCTDDVGNFIELDSEERKITAQNKDESYITIDKRQIKAFAADQIYMQSDDIQAHCKTFLVEASETVIVNAGQSTTLTAPETTINADTSMTVNTALWTLNTPLMQNNVATTNFTGAVNIAGLATLSGGLAATPGAPGAAANISVPVNVTGATDITGAFSTTGTMTNNGINVGSTHTHIEQGDGAPVSPPS